MSSVLAGEPPRQAGAPTSPGRHPSPVGPPPFAPRPGADAAAQRGNTLAVIAGVGVLLLAMGVGVLIGRAGGSKSSPASTPTISVAAPAVTPTTQAPGAEATFTSSWPAGTSGYTVQLQTLPESGTPVSAVEAAKSSASGKGAKEVGALKSEEFSTLTPGNYVIYSGVYHGKAQAQKALGGLRKSFPGASVIHVANGASSSSRSPSSSGSSGTTPGAGANQSHPAPPTVLKGLDKSKGKSYEEKSKSLPNVVETG